MAEERLEEIRAARLARRAALIKEGRVPYPAEVRRTHTIGEVHDSFATLLADSVPILLLGRVVALRRHGGLAFVDLTDASGTMQLQFARDEGGGEVLTRLTEVDVGDFLQASGLLTTTERGVETLLASDFHIVCKSIRPLPSGWHGLKDKEKRYRQREVDLLLNETARAVLIMRSRVIAWLRHFLTAQGYLEVETPVLQPIPGGAAARPFATHHNALNIPLYLRISAELYLKRLLVGGYEKVFEIERRFRNEGVDRQHNPEFTMLESQLAYADYEDLMDFTEEVLEKLCRDLLGSSQVTWQGTELSFAKPFKRVRYVDLVSERLGVDILEQKEPRAYAKLFEKEGLEVPEAINYAKLVDELYKELIRPTLIQPTLLYDYPVELAPLAKPKVSDPRVAEKFQLLVHGLELNTCYTEANDPVLQRAALEEQQRSLEAGDEEAQRVDEEYLRALEYGMPPNAGWSLGIDRFVMLLTDSPAVRDTIAFPLLKPE